MGSAVSFGVGVMVEQEAVTPETIDDRHVVVEGPPPPLPLHPVYSEDLRKILAKTSYPVEERMD